MNASTKALLALVGFTAAANVLLQGLGFIDRSSLRDLGIGAFCAILGALVWEVVERRARRTERPGTAAWIAFPLSIFLAIASLPFLALAVYPPLREFLLREGRVEASIAGDGTRLDVYFPRPVEPGPINLRLDGTEIPPAYAARAREVFQWRSPHRLTVDLTRLAADLPGAPARPSAVGINNIVAAPRFRYEDGKAVPQQRVVVR